MYQIDVDVEYSKKYTKRQTRLVCNMLNRDLKLLPKLVATNRVSSSNTLS